MNDILVSMFRSIFVFVAWASILGCVAVGGFMVAVSDPASAFLGWMILIAGPIIAVTLSGTVAVMIQNNDLLRRIADKEMNEETQIPPRASVPPVASVRREPSLR